MQGQPSQSMGAKPANFRQGDWSCPSCQAHNFASKAACFKCRSPKPGGVDNAALGLGGSAALGLGGLDQSALLSLMNQNLMTQNLLGMIGGNSGVGGLGGLGGLSGLGALGISGLGGGLPPNFRAGDWFCPSCNAHNYQSKTSCFTCHRLKPGLPPAMAALNATSQGAGNPPGFRSGDWMCVCGNHNFASRTQCHKCHANRHSGPVADVANALDVDPTDYTAALNAFIAEAPVRAAASEAPRARSRSRSPSKTAASATTRSRSRSPRRE